MSINLNQLVQGALTEGVLQQLAQRIGCAPESAKRVVSLCAPALIGSMMNKASSLDGARNLFAAIMSPSTNAHIAEELPHAVVYDEDFKSLVEAGSKADEALASRDGMNMLSERISDYTGVASQATRTISGVVGATVLGVLKRHFSQHNGQVGQLPGLLGHQMPAVRANMTDSFAQALGLGSVGAFLAGVASRLKTVTAHLEHPQPAAPQVAAPQVTAFPVQTDTAAHAQSGEAGESGHKKAWFWVASAAALALFAVLSSRGCTTDQAQQTAADASPDNNASAADAASVPALAVSAAASASDAASVVVAASAPAAVAAPVPSKGAIMAASVDASGVPTLNATVGSAEEKQRLLDLLAVKLGLDKFHANITVDPDTKSASWLDKLSGLMPVLTQPGAQVRIAGDDIELSGTAADAKFGWLDKLKALFGTGWNIGLGSAPQAAPEPVAKVEPVAKAEPVAQENANATSAARCEAANVTGALDLKSVNFRIGSKALPPSSMAALANSARVLKHCSTAAKPIKLNIAGYTDTTGNEATNLQLSKQRAQAVRAYLIKQGVPADTMTASGFGEANPIADNSTREGRMANRRIEIKVAG